MCDTFLVSTDWCGLRIDRARDRVPCLVFHSSLLLNILHVISFKVNNVSRDGFMRRVVAGPATLEDGYSLKVSVSRSHLVRIS